MQAGQNNEYDYIFIYYSKKQFLHEFCFQHEHFHKFLLKKLKKCEKIHERKKFYQHNFIKATSSNHFVLSIFNSDFYGFYFEFYKTYELIWLSLTFLGC